MHPAKLSCGESKLCLPNHLSTFKTFLVAAASNPDEFLNKMPQTYCNLLDVAILRHRFMALIIIILHAGSSIYIQFHPVPCSCVQHLNLAANFVFLQEVVSSTPFIYQGQVKTICNFPRLLFFGKLLVYLTNVFTCSPISKFIIIRNWSST